MLLLTNIHGKASNQRHYGASLLAFWLICTNISRFNYIRSSRSCFIPEVSPPQLPAEVKKSSSENPLPPPPFFGKQTVSQQLHIINNSDWKCALGKYALPDNRAIFRNCP